MRAERGEGEGARRSMDYGINGSANPQNASDLHLRYTEIGPPHYGLNNPG